jgi:hypothetical protein
LRLESLDIFLDRNSVLLCFDCKLALDHLHLLGSGLLSGLRHARRRSLGLAFLGLAFLGLAFRLALRGPLWRGTFGAHCAVLDE